MIENDKANTRFEEIIYYFKENNSALREEVMCLERVVDELEGPIAKVAEDQKENDENPDNSVTSRIQREIANYNDLIGRVSQIRERLENNI